ncbi:hypothetical protein D3C86_1529310 [compost metagenome]
MGESQVLVSTGKVEVTLNKRVKDPLIENKVVLLQANEEAILANVDGYFGKEKIKVPLPLSTESTLKTFNFSATPFSVVVNELEKAYNISISYDQKVMGNCQLTASLIDQSLDERLRLICKAVEATYRYERGKVIIEGNGCTNNSI